MAVWNTNYANSLLATTFEAYSPTLYDQVFQDCPTWAWLKKHQEPVDGGTKITARLLYAQSGRSKSFSKGESFGIGEADIVTVAQYDWCNYGTAIPIYRQDLMDNRGRSAILNLAKAKMDEAELDLKDTIADDLWASSRASTKDIVPLPVIVDTTSTVGNINSTTYSQWRANVDSTTEAVNVADMVTIYNNCRKGVGSAYPSFMPCGQTFFEGYEALGGDALHLTDAERANLDLGFLPQGFRFKGAVMVFDQYMTAGDCYFLNERFVKWQPHTDCSAGWIHEQENAHDVPGLTLHLIWGRGAITTGRRASLGKITGKTAP